MSYYLLAQALWFSKVVVADIEADYGLVFRKGKTADDILAAIAKARDPSNGMAKTEVELGMLEIYLQSVFKRKKETK